ncbi:MAG: Minf_1886 family protein [Kiritimatiellales bacterium]
MKHPNTEELLQNILTRDPRYTAEAYAFVRAGLDYTVRRLEKPRHVSGQELLSGLREFALTEFGPMTKTVLNGWGIQRTEDIGEIVFNMVEAGMLGKTENDSRADFANGYDFAEAFSKPFWPSVTPHVGKKV